MANYTKIAELNEKVFTVSAEIQLLGNVSWPAAAQEQFLNSYKQGRIQLPEVHYAKPNYSEQETVLKQLKNSFTANDPLEIFTKKTIDSYLDAIELNKLIGRPEFTQLSIKLFGSPGDVLPNSAVTNIAAAELLVLHLGSQNPNI